MDNDIYLTKSYKIYQQDEPIDCPLALFTDTVREQWIDYNGHMSESFYLYAMGEASDALFRYVGIDEAYRALGSSFYTVETHINYYQEVAGDQPLRFTTQILGIDTKRLHFFHHMYHGDTGELLATTEQMLLHVDMNTSSAAPIQPQVLAVLEQIWQAHKHLPAPKQQGRVMAVPSAKKT
ncbi:thioesterase family protein [Oceanospirillaceae bacterium]|nr:thioesterase family protein [Oceanospirillaceae bacterium]